MPLGLIRYTWPLAFKFPRICVPLLPRMRLSAMALDDGCRKLTVSCAAMLKLCQLRERFWLDCWMVVVALDWEMLPVPETTCPPVGEACASGANASKSAVAMSLRLSSGFLRALVVFSATVTQVLSTWLQTRWLMRFFEAWRFMFPRAFH